MSESKDVIIRFAKKLHWNWYVSCGKWQAAGYGDSFDDAEKYALEYVKGIPNHGIVHIMYDEITITREKR